MTNQTTYFSFTLNNYSVNDIVKIKNFAKNFCYRLMYGEEVAPTTGTPHLQGCFQLINRSRLETIKNIIDIPEIHLECQKKTYLANARYCEKSGNVWYFPDKKSNFQNGKIITKKNEKYSTAIDLAKKGKFDEIDPEIYLKYEQKLTKLFVENIETENLLLKNKYGNFFCDFFILIHGPTGTGKSFLVEDIIYCLEYFWKELGNQKPLHVYYKKCNKWWDGYKGEKIIVIEELEPQWTRISGNLLKQLLDQYPFPVECKGSTINKIRPFFVIMTSNYNLKQLCSRDDGTIIQENYDPLNRRLYQACISKFGNFINWPRFDNLKLYFDTHQEVKEERHKEKEERRLKLLNQIDLGNSLSVITQPSDNIPESIVNSFDSIQLLNSQNDNVYDVFFCEFYFDNIENFNQYNLFKKVISCLEKTTQQCQFNIYDLKFDLYKKNKHLTNLQDAYSILNTLQADGDIFNNVNDKHNTLSDTLNQIKNCKNEILNIEQEIQQNYNIYYDSLLKINKFKDLLNELVINTNKTFKYKDLVSKNN